MENRVDRRLVCSADKKASIREALLATGLKRQSQVCKVYECKIVEKRLTKRQREQLKMLFIEGKWFYNHVLSVHKSGELLKDINTSHVKSVSHYDKDKNMISSELQVLSSQQKQAIVARMISNEKTISTLFKKGLQKHGSLQFKSDFSCVPLKQHGVTYRFKSCNKVKIQGISGYMLMRTGGQLEAVDEFANANLIKKPDGCYLKVTCFINKENFKTLKTNGKEIGLDFGIKTNITTSEGGKLDVTVEESDRLKKLQKEMFRRARGSNNQHKTVKLIQREYQKLSNRKEDKANKIVSKLKAYSCICMQDEQIAGWQKGLFGKQVQHSCLGRVKQKLKGLPQTIILDKWIPTTKWCPSCGKKNDISLSKRTYSCSCGYHEDRDVHSAKNMLATKNLVFKNRPVPTEHREITLMEFKAAIADSIMLSGTSPDAEVRRCSVFS